ncbi:BQ5605_C028g10536 [Microbotryum silenes-dioicae]|uniref:BQ5605_C028g10536 protein n=1 Tax=Microbotryum silenes-dioicae TaxID=796604 RepID=A0A2X0NBH4_9BASI|nr:BQ5605_C028g10536 [Microbotryum silenes-dioicae]
MAYHNWGKGLASCATPRRSSKRSEGRTVLLQRCGSRVVSRKYSTLGCRLQSQVGPPPAPRIKN